MSWDESRGIPSVELNKFCRDVTDKLAARLSVKPHLVKLFELGYKDADTKDIIRPDLPTPAILIKFIRIRPKTWISQGRTIVLKQNNRVCVELVFKAHVIVKAGRKNEGEEAQNLAVGLAIAVNTESKFGHEGVGPAQLHDIVPEDYVDFSKDDEIDCKDSFAVWTVEWHHDSLIGNIYTAGYYDEEHYLPESPNDPEPYKPIDISTVKEVYLSFDSKEGKIPAQVIENEINGIKHRIYKNIDPNTGQRLDDDKGNYVLIVDFNFEIE